MKKYYRIMLGKGSVYADDAYNGKFIGAGWIGKIDLTNKLPDNWKDFNKEIIPVMQKEYPDKSRVALGLFCGFLWTIAKGIQVGDVVLCPNGKGAYFVGEISSEYEFHKGDILPHRRRVKWFTNQIDRIQMSDALQNSTGSIGTSSEITKYSKEIELLIAGDRPPLIIATDETIEDPVVFALEKHLEDFLVENWKNTNIGKNYNIFKEDGELVGQQYPTDSGPIDILAVSKDKKELLVLELKKGRVSDTVIGQVQRYMGFVKDELAEKNQIVKGVIIAFKDDPQIRRTLSMTNNIEFYTYKIDFKLEKIK